MKVLFVVRALDYGGAERQLVVLAEGLHNKGHNVAVALFYSGGRFEKELLRCGVTIHYLEKKGRWDILSFLVRFGRLIRKTNPDVIYGFLSLPNILSVLYRRLSPKAKVIFGIRASGLGLDHYEPLVGWVYKLENILSRYSDLVIVNSKAGRLYCIEQSFDRSKLLTIYNGINTDYFSPDIDGGKEFRRSNDIDVNDILIGIVGRLDPMKDHATFLGAFARVLKSVPRLKALVIGKGVDNELEKLQALTERLGIAQNVIWKKPVEFMPPIYSAIDVLVSSSRFGEGFPNVVAEAMSCETPCIVTKVGDSADIVDLQECVVEPENMDELADRIKTLLLNKDYKKYGKEARKRIQTCYSIEQYIDSTEEALCSVMSARS